jgi:C4-dicarboxylate-binding protein DctP
MKKLLPGFAAGLASLAIMAGSAGAADFVFKYGNAQPEADARSQSMVYFEKELESRSGGRIDVQNYFSAVLGNEREMMDQVTTGLIQGTRGGFFAETNPKFSILLLPFLVANWDEAVCLVNSDWMKQVQAGASKGRYHVPATGISQGFRAHTNNVRPLRTPADLIGLKMRVPQQEVYIETAKAMGASPQAMPFSEAYQAFKTGVIDGQDNPPANIWAFKIQEVQKYMSITNYSTGPDPLIVNKAWYDKLPGDLKKLFDKVAAEAVAYSVKLYRDGEADIIKELGKSMAINYVKGGDLAKFVARAQSVHDIFIAKGDFSQADIDAAKKAARSCS